MRVTVISGEMLYRMHRLKQELEENKPRRRRRLAYIVATAAAVVAILVWGRSK